MIKQLIFIVSLLIGFSSILSAQELDHNPFTKGLVQFSGIISEIDSNSLVPYATIENMNNKQKYMSNYQGYFSFVVTEGDTIKYTSIGFDSYQMVIPKGLKDHKYTIKIGMKMNVTTLPTFNVFPWATIEEFNRDFLTLKFSDDDLEIARQNINRKAFLEMAKITPKDGRSMQIQSNETRHNMMTQKNMIPTSNFFSPIAWAKFINQITNSDKKKN